MTLSTPPQTQQNGVARRFLLLLQNIWKHIHEVGSGHLFNFCLAPSWAEKTYLESSNTDLRGLAAAETRDGFHDPPPSSGIPHWQQSHSLSAPHFRPVRQGASFSTSGPALGPKTTGPSISSRKFLLDFVYVLQPLVEAGAEVKLDLRYLHWGPP